MNWLTDYHRATRFVSMVPDLNAIRDTLRTLDQQIAQLNAFWNLPTREDLTATEARIISAIKNSGKPVDLTALVDAGEKLEAETKSLQNAVNQNQPPKKEQNT